MSLGPMTVGELPAADIADARLIEARPETCRLFIRPYRREDRLALGLSCRSLATRRTAYLPKSRPPASPSGAALGQGNLRG